MKKKIVIISLLLASFVLSAETAKDVIKVFCDLDRVPDYNYSTLILENIDKNGKSELIEINQYGSGVDNGLKNVAFDFRSPANVKGMRVLQLEKIKKADDRFVYMPQLRQARRIPMADRTKSFGGTEFTYNDMTIRNEDEDDNVMIEDSSKVTVRGTSYTCWKIKSTPYKKSEVEYHYRISWFDKKTYIPVRIEFYDTHDKMIKLYECLKIDMVKGVTGIEYPLRRSNCITNLETGRKTFATVKDFVFDEEISDTYFTQNWLVTGKAPKIKNKKK
ncbi:MAG: outer membrane lipoprotein-sorting protein [Treponema sp.]|uniref:outer membrane lipoprotein-sorting protein n=1 Tax=Treponema sp. TaxID=166 RepID=UPI0025D58E92|nr:outer membrane lipoprotein-sorting protein [Treponema sp.]MBQ9281170.1 outer membrane lipoprotein-sorting protein [Treponema sp.]